MRHTCHALQCTEYCAPKHLMCQKHWAMVPQHLQRAVYLTVGKRGETVDATWAPWWRAQARAIAHVAKQEYGGDVGPYLEIAMRTADKMEKGG